MSAPLPPSALLSGFLKQSIPDPPEDFEAFWRRTYADAEAIPTRFELREVSSAHSDFRTFEVEFDSLGGFRSGGWVTMPRSGPIERGVVVSHGYGGREFPEPEFPGPPAVAIFPCARGFNRSAKAGYPNVSSSHVLHGIRDRETYSHRGCVAEIWAAATVLLEAFPEVGPMLHYSGSSFGGGIGAMALPWDKRFSRAFLSVPSFGNHPVRVRTPCVGSGESVRLLAEQMPEILGTLRYFDAAVAGQFCRVPTLVAAALDDPTVPPAGQFSVFNALAGPRELFVRKQGHPDLLEDELKLAPILEQWWRLPADAVNV